MKASAGCLQPRTDLASRVPHPTSDTLRSRKRLVSPAPRPKSAAGGPCPELPPLFSRNPLRSVSRSGLCERPPGVPAAGGAVPGAPRGAAGPARPPAPSAAIGRAPARPPPLPALIAAGRGRGAGSCRNAGRAELSALGAAGPGAAPGAARRAAGAAAARPGARGCHAGARGRCALGGAGAEHGAALLRRRRSLPLRKCGAGRARGPAPAAGGSERLLGILRRVCLLLSWCCLALGWCVVMLVSRWLCERRGQRSVQRA